jgi:hypothetical protein
MTQIKKYNVSGGKTDENLERDRERREEIATLHL